MDDLSFNSLKFANAARCEQRFHLISEWSPSDWSNAMAGEAGETCNLTKKLLRGESVSLTKIADEIADTVIYADLLATRLGLDLKDCIRNKFNKVSEKIRSDIRL